MAYLEERNGRYRVAFRHAVKLYRQNLKAVPWVEAVGCLAQVEEGLRLLACGRLEIPLRPDLGLFLLTDGKVSSRPARAAEPSSVVTLGQLRDAFLEAQARAVEENTLYTLRIHFKHLVESLGVDFDLARLKLGHLDRHVAQRLAMPGRRGQPLHPNTARKEIRTLASAWVFGSRRGLVLGALPAVGLVYPKSAERPPFRTRAEIAALVTRGSDDPEV